MHSVTVSVLRTLKFHCGSFQSRTCYTLIFNVLAVSNSVVCSNHPHVFIIQLFIPNFDKDQSHVHCVSGFPHQPLCAYCLKILVSCYFILMYHYIQRLVGLHDNNTVIIPGGIIAINQVCYTCNIMSKWNYVHVNSI